MYSVLFICRLPLCGLFFYVPNAVLFPINSFFSLEKFLWSFFSLICACHSVVFFCLLLLMMILLGMVGWLSAIHSTNLPLCRNPEVCVFDWLTLLSAPGMELEWHKTTHKMLSPWHKRFRVGHSISLSPIRLKPSCGNGTLPSSGQCLEFITVNYATASAILLPWEKWSWDQIQPGKKKNTEKETGETHKSSDQSLPEVWPNWTLMLSETIYFLKGEVTLNWIFLYLKLNILIYF